MMKKTTIAIVLSSALFMGCASQNYSNTQKGAAAGAIVGAIAGKATGDHDKSRYAWGAVVGALAGGAIGNYMDKQEKQMREELSDTGVEIYREGDQLRLVMPSGITFDSNQSNLAPEFYPVLDDVARVVNNYDKTVLQIVGHTDSTGSAAYNKELSLARANQVENFLLKKGVDQRRLQVEGQGEFAPIASNDTAQGKEQNRRVELTILPVSETS